MNSARFVRLASNSIRITSRPSCLLPNRFTPITKTFNTTQLRNMSEKGQFEMGHKPPVTKQSFPGLEKDMPMEPYFEELPTADGKSTPYLGAGKLKGKHAVITGGDSGIGRASAILFAKEGADSLIVYLPEEEEDAQETKKRVEHYGQRCFLISTDLRQRDNCKKVVDEALKVFDGRVDILFNNAAYQMQVDKFTDIPDDQWVHTFDTNIHSFFYMTKYLLPHMPLPGATIVNNASINAFKGNASLVDYSSTKGAIVAFTRSLSLQYVGQGLRINCVAPGPVWTPLIPSTMTHEMQSNFTTPMGRPNQPSEVAACVVFLAGPDSSALSGQTIHCNGGAANF
jgi:NAD(P)-dependent dehydrogenase (short-subunit alcohol dehydrogenase family)